MLVRTTISGSLIVLATACSADKAANSGTPDAPEAIDAHVTPDADLTGVTAVPLTSIGGGYAASFTLGTQPFDMIVDTGSSSTGVAATTCTNCGVQPEYTSSSAVDLHQPASAEYGSGSWKGEVFEDAATMGGRPPVMLDFASITSQTGFFQGPSFQGILGLGPDGLLLPHTTSYLTKSIAAGMTAQLAFQLCPDSGTMWLGGYDTAATAAAPSFTPILAGLPYYMINVGGVSVGGAPLTVTGADFGPTIIDTGTTLTFVPKAVETAIISAVHTSTGYAQVFGSQALTDGACLTTTMTSAQIDAALPPLALALGGTPISIPATRSYLFDQGGGQYCFAFSDSSALAGGQKVSLFGNTLLAGMVTIFDLANNQLGFAPQQGCAAASFERRPSVIRPPSLPAHWNVSL